MRDCEPLSLRGISCLDEGFMVFVRKIEVGDFVLVESFGRVRRSIYIASVSANDDVGIECRVEEQSRIAYLLR